MTTGEQWKIDRDLSGWTLFEADRTYPLDFYLGPEARNRYPHCFLLGDHLRCTQPTGE